MRVSIIIAFCSICIVGCSNKRIEITPEYIINGNWNKQNEDKGANSIAIKRMKVQTDSTINPFSDLSQADLLNKLEVDSSFIYTANVKIRKEESYDGKKIYFNRDNGFYWWANQGEHKIKILGKLQQRNWYEISRLNFYYYLIYIDSADEVHRFIVNLANY